MPSSRYRAFYLAEALEELGHQAVVTPVNRRSIGAVVHYAQTLISYNSDDVVVLQRTVYNKYFFIAVLISYLFGRRFIFDIDDAVYEHSPMQSTVLARLARVVTCGSEHILEWAKKQNKNSHLLFNGLPLSIYTPRIEEPEILTIGWIGNGPAHYENLKILVPVFETLAQQGIQFRFRLVGACGDSRIHSLFKNIGVPVDIVDTLNWADPREAVNEIHKFTIGVMPLTGETWNQAKYFKALEYMACGVPVVASATDSLKKIISKAKCGSIIETKKGWVSAISRLLSEGLLREKEGVCGREYIIPFHSSKAMAQILLSYTAS